MTLLQSCTNFVWCFPQIFEEPNLYENYFRKVCTMSKPKVTYFYDPDVGNCKYPSKCLTQNFPSNNFNFSSLWSWPSHETSENSSHTFTSFELWTSQENASFPVRNPSKHTQFFLYFSIDFKFQSLHCFISRHVEVSFRRVH